MTKENNSEELKKILEEKLLNKENTIKSIVTKEEFERCEYKI